MGKRTRLYLALAVMLAIPAKSALATSAVETARVQEPVVQTAVVPVASQGAPESPLAIAGSLAMADSALQIQLAEPGERDASLLDLAFEVSPQQ
jgi:hypothetical protein